MNCPPFSKKDGGSHGRQRIGAAGAKLPHGSIELHLAGDHVAVLPESTTSGAGQRCTDEPVRAVQVNGSEVAPGGVEGGFGPSERLGEAFLIFNEDGCDPSQIIAGRRLGSGSDRVGQ